MKTYLTKTIITAGLLAAIALGVLGYNYSQADSSSMQLWAAAEKGGCCPLSAQPVAKKSPCGSAALASAEKDSDCTASCSKKCGDKCTKACKKDGKCCKAGEGCCKAAKADACQSKSACTAQLAADTKKACCGTCDGKKADGKKACNTASDCKKACSTKAACGKVAHDAPAHKHLANALAMIEKSEQALKNNQPEAAIKSLNQANEIILTAYRRSLTSDIANQACPMMGNPVKIDQITPALVRYHDGKAIAFCCAACPAKWDQLSDQEKSQNLNKPQPSAAAAASTPVAVSEAQN